MSWDLVFNEADVRAALARSQVGRGRYLMGKGGTDPHADHPFSKGGFCDCSGLVAWCCGYPRQVDLATEEWWNTDALLREAGRGIHWEFVDEGDYRAGDVIVYPGIDLDRDGKRDRVGHTGVIVQGSSLIAACRVVHCRKPKNGKGPAVVETSGDPWVGRHKYRGQTKERWRSRVIRPVSGFATSDPAR